MSLKLSLVRLAYWCKSWTERPVELFKALDVRPGDDILEVGCAAGYHTFSLAEVAFKGKIYAVDVWEEGIALIKSRMRPEQNIKVICGGAETIELAPSSLDKIVCFDTLHDVSDLERSVERWAGFLKDGGKFLYRDPVIGPDKIRLSSKGMLQETEMIKGVHVFIRH